MAMYTVPQLFISISAVSAKNCQLVCVYMYIDGCMCSKIMKIICLVLIDRNQDSYSHYDHLTINLCIIMYISYVYVCAYINICNNILICKYIYIEITWVDIRVHKNTFITIYPCTLHKHTCFLMYVCMYVYLSDVHVCLYDCMSACVCKYVYIYT